MKLLIVRHAIAEDPTESSQGNRDDRQRPLTTKGRVRMEQGVAGLSKLIPEIDLIAHSPLLRAQQTADILCTRFPKAKRVEVEELEPGAGAKALGHWLHFVSQDALVALVGHEPDLSRLVGWLASGEERSLVRMKKGSVAYLECTGKPAAAGVELQWLLTPSQLRLLAGG
ncbi:MAG: phosphohistidine phosphatase SixA [Gammaproteobacteria bacterium]|nr:phosphohistidine phosphatase SixA [Gammaproteobacteria bacterium]MBU1654777.1 phosphohistidine phosphatase SixA [Gammaproteobacteria bacterium]MBU1962650.1 phosphohistidine phosphatase SixA [Gammaproteobacteria bacterium]